LFISLLDVPSPTVLVFDVPTVVFVVLVIQFFVEAGAGVLRMWSSILMMSVRRSFSTAVLMPEWTKHVSRAEIT